MSFTFGLTAEGTVYYRLFNKRIKEVPLADVACVEQRVSKMSLGDTAGFRIKYRHKGKVKSFPFMDCKAADPDVAAFLAALRAALGPEVEWVDARHSAAKTEGEWTYYDLQYLPLGYGGAGLPRTAQLWMYLVLFGLLILPLPFYIWLVSAGGYRIATSADGLALRKWRLRLYTWDELERVEIRRVGVSGSGSNTEVVDVFFFAGGKRTKVIMRLDHARPLLQELADRGKIAPEVPAALGGG